MKELNWEEMTQGTVKNIAIQDTLREEIERAQLKDVGMKVILIKQQEKKLPVILEMNMGRMVVPRDQELRKRILDEFTHQDFLFILVVPKCIEI